MPLQTLSFSLSVLALKALLGLHYVTLMSACLSHWWCFVSERHRRNDFGANGEVPKLANRQLKDKSTSQFVRRKIFVIG